MPKKITVEKEDRKAVGERLKTLAESKGMSVHDMAELLGYSEGNQIYGFYRGDKALPVKKIADLSEAWNLRVNYLLCKDDYPTDSDMVAAFGDNRIKDYDCREAYLNRLGFDIQPRIFSPFTVRQILDHKDEILQYCDEESKIIINDTVAEWTNTDKMKEHFAALFDDNNDDFGAVEVDIDPDYFIIRVSWDRLPDPDIKAHLMDVETGKGSKSQVRVRHTGSLKELKNAFTEMKKLKESPVNDYGSHIIKYKNNAPVIDYYYELRYCIYRDESFLAALSPDELIFTFKHLDNMARNIMIDCADIPNIPPMKSIDRMMFI